MKNKCRSCGAEVIWARGAKSDKWAPLEPTPDPAGYCVLSRDGTYRVLAPTAPTPVGATRHTNHFAVCPDAMSIISSGTAERSNTTYSALLSVTATEDSEMYKQFQ